MRMTITNGNARNQIRGQRVTFRADTGHSASVVLPCARARKYRPALLDLAKQIAWAEGVATHSPRTAAAEQMLRMFTEGKARRIVKWNV